MTQLDGKFISIRHMLLILNSPFICTANKPYCYIYEVKIMFLGMIFSQIFVGS